jgi:hypothetical protein
MELDFAPVANDGAEVCEINHQLLHTVMFWREQRDIFHVTEQPLGNDGLYFGGRGSKFLIGPRIDSPGAEHKRFNLGCRNLQWRQIIT